MNGTLFPMPPAAPKGLGNAISKPQCLEILAMSILVHEINPILRGDGKSAGHAVIIDSLPTYSALGIDHTARTAFAALSGLIYSGDIEELRGDQLNGIEVPQMADILRKAVALQERFAVALETAAAHVRTLKLAPADE
jgi:hypothetical protein